MKSITDMIVEGDVYNINEVIEAALKNSKPLDVLEELIAGLHRAGELYQKGEIFIIDIMSAAETFKEAMKLVQPALGKAKRKFLGKIVLGTVEGDIHDIGKNIVAVMLEGAGFEVVDLGIDISPEKFVEAVKMHKPQIVALSALITSTMMKMEETINALKKAGIRNKVKIMVGGAPVSERYAQSIGADSYAIDAVGAINKAIALLK